MVFLLALGSIPMAMVLAAGVLEWWARRRQWPGFEDPASVRWQARRRR